VQKYRERRDKYREGKYSDIDLDKLMKESRQTYKRERRQTYRERGGKQKGDKYSDLSGKEETNI